MNKLHNEFGTSELANSAREQHEQLQKTMTPAQRRLSEEAQAAMAEVEDVFYGNGAQGTRFSQELLNLIHDLAGPTVEARRAVAAQIQALKPGQGFPTDVPRLYKTVDGKIELTKAYVSRLEKALIAVMTFKLEEVLKKRKVSYKTKRALKRLIRSEAFSIGHTVRGKSR